MKGLLFNPSQEFLFEYTCPDIHMVSTVSLSQVFTSALARRHRGDAPVKEIDHAHKGFGYVHIEEQHGGNVTHTLHVTY